jgi:acyl-CoA synthetase (AMP-forming)/AMP-acid ligase II
VQTVLDIDKPAVSTLPDLLRLRATDNPDGIPYGFLIDGVQETATLTHREVHRRATAIAAHLSRLAAPGDRALLVYPPGLSFNTAFWACLYAGVIACPAALPQANKPEAGVARLRSIAVDAGATLLLTVDDYGVKLAPVLDRMSGLRLVATDVVEAAATAPGVPEPAFAPPALTAESIAYLQYSSGSTGTPKGVTLTHGNVLANVGLIGDVCHILPGASGVGWLPTFHDMGLVAQVLQPVFSDFTAWTMAPMSFVQRPFSWLEAMSALRATITVAPNFGYALALRRVPPARLAELDLSALQVALCGAEPLRADTLRGFTERFAEAGMRPTALFPCYGLAEATLMVTGAPFDTGLVVSNGDPQALASGRFEETDGPGRALVASGALYDRARVVIVDPVTLVEVPGGTVGEVCASGDGIAVGYWNNEAETERVLRARIPGHEGRAFLRTGDLGFVHDGQLYITGRLKDLLIIDGYNHYPQDLEFTAQASHPAIRENGCAAFQVDDGDGGRERLVLVVEVERKFRVYDDVTTDVEQPGTRASEIVRVIQLAVGASHGLRIDELVLTGPQAIPLTSSGKIQRYACRAQHLAGELPVLVSVGPSGAPTGSALVRTVG